MEFRVISLLLLFVSLFLSCKRSCTCVSKTYAGGEVEEVITVHVEDSKQCSDSVVTADVITG